jgi:hypothetical protein
MNVTKKLALVTAGTALLGPLMLATAPAAMATETTEKTCKTGALPTVVVGSPNLKRGEAAAIYLWHDGNGYSLRVTHPGKEKLVVSGKITVSRHVHAFRRVSLERNDMARVGPRRHQINFKFNNYGGIDGFDFKAQCSAKVKVELKVGDAQATPAQVFLGKDRTSPTSVPFTIERATGAVPAKVS